MKQNYALLISGNHKNCCRYTAMFKKFLLKQGFDYFKIYEIPKSAKDKASILNESKNFAEEVDNENGKNPVVIAYNGHGLEKYFFPNGIHISYEKWAQTLPKAPIIFINNSCHSGGSIRIFKKVGLLPSKALLLTSSRESEYTLTPNINIHIRQGFLQRIINSYKQNQPFLERIISTHKLVGKYTLRIGSSKQSPAPNDLDNNLEWGGFVSDIGQLEYEEYNPPKKAGYIQHPQRCGLDLDHILYKEETY